MTDEDLVVLLSERAAREIHKKWCDTLEVRLWHIGMLMRCRLWHIMSCSGFFRAREMSTSSTCRNSCRKVRW